MSIAQDLVKKVAHAAQGVRAGEEKLASRRLAAGVKRFTMTSPAFIAGGRIPRRFTSDGEGVSPELLWEAPPPGTRALVLLVEDPDAPFPRPFVHWIVYGLDPTTRALTEAETQLGRVGKNTMQKAEWTPPAPPPGHGPHRYVFQLFALDAPVELEPGAGRGAIERAMEGHVVGLAELVGIHER